MIRTTTLLAAVSLLAMTSSKAKAQTFIGRTTQPQVQNRLLDADALWAMGRMGAASVSVDGKNLVYNVSYYSTKQNKSHTVIYTNTVDGQHEQLLTTENASEYSPRFMPDGQHISYLAPDKKGDMQVWSMKPDGSDRVQLSDRKGGVDDYLFSPDGTKAILIISEPRGSQVTPDWRNQESVKKATGRVIDEAFFRHWDEYVTTTPQPFLYIYKEGKLTPATQSAILGDEPFECPMKPFGGVEQLAWSPDSKQIAYTCRKKTGRAAAVSTDSDIFLYDLATGKTKNLCKPADYVAPEVDYTLSLKDQAVNAPIKEGKDYNLGYDINPAFSPDGKYVAWQSMERDGYESDRNRLCIYELATGKKVYATEKFESNVDAFCWSENGKELYFVGTWHGTTHVYRTTPKGEVKQLTEGQYDYSSVQLCGKGGLLCTRQSMKEPAELFLVNRKDGKATQVTHENQAFIDAIDWGDVQPRWTKSVDGKDILSWIVTPPNFDPTKKYPTLLFCEGGPQSPVSQFWSYRWNLQIMAAHGYVVVCPNRRGLPGFGMEWLEEISTNYGGRCMQDLLSAIDDAAENLPYVDKDRLGCVGASFGGFSVYWMAGNHDHRFKCFIAHDGIYNLDQQYVETEEAWFTNWDLGGAPWRTDNEAVQRSYAASPHHFIKNWDAPILCIHGEKDYRIAYTQAMAAFNAARYQGVEAELLLFPDENHWVLKPQNGILWQTTFFRWLDRWLK